MGRIQRGEKTPEAEYVVPILQALVQAGGRGRTAEIVDRVGQIMKGRLNEYDYKQLGAGTSPVTDGSFTHHEIDASNSRRCSRCYFGLRGHRGHRIPAFVR